MKKAELRDLLKYILKLCMRIILRIYYIFPIDNRKMLFMSTMGKSYSCNPKYIYEAVLKDERFRSYKIYWVFKSPTEWKNVLFKDTKTVNRRNVLLYFYHLLTSKVIVYNCGGFSYAPIRKKQLLIETWHGSPFKSGALEQENKSIASKKGILLADKDIKLYLSQSKFQTDILIRRAHGYSGEVLECGCPRDDIFFNVKEDRIKEIRDKLDLKEKEFIVIYAPTFKGTEDNAVNLNTHYETIDPVLVKNALKDRFGGKWLFATRGHQYGGNLMLEGADLNWSSYPDMQELLLISDILITDYSSSIWDFSLTGKPCFLFVPDIENYRENDRGFLIPFEIWPGIACTGNKELQEEIRAFDDEKYRVRVQDFLKKAVSYEKGNACQQVIEWISKRIK